MSTSRAELRRRDPRVADGLEAIVSRFRGGQWWRWAAVPLGLLYVILLGAQFHDVIRTTYLDSDTASAPVIGQLFGGAPAHATVVLGEFGWYATLLFELATKWLPAHRQIWESAPYAMALAGAALTAWSVWQVAGRWAASLTAVVLVCAAPPTLHLLLSMTQHAPDWFCLALLAAFLVLLELRATAIKLVLLVPVTLVVGVVVGINAASDPLVVISALVPFALAVSVGRWLARGSASVRIWSIGLGTVAVAALSWAVTSAAMSGLNIGPEPGLHTTALATADEVSSNFRLWWHSIAVLGNGDFFGRDLSFASGLAVACAAVSVGAVIVLPRLGWQALRVSPAARTSPAARARLTFMVYWCSSAVLLSAAFLLSATPVDIHSDRYLLGLIYAAAAVVPAAAVGRLPTELAALAGTCVFALGGVISMAKGTITRNTAGFVSGAVANQIAHIAAIRHLGVGYSGYWEAAPITWNSNFRALVYPVSVCDQNAHLCRFDLHVISSWYSSRPGVRSFLLADPSLPNAAAPTPDLGPPAAVYHIGRITMYAYPYDLASKIRP